MSKKLGAAIVLLVLQIIAALGIALSGAGVDMFSAYGFGVQMGVIGQFLFTIVAIVLIIAELHSKKATSNTNFCALDKHKSRQIKEVEQALMDNRTYMYNSSDLENILANSLVNGSLDYALLDINVSDFDDTVLEKQTKIETLIKEKMLPEVFSSQQIENTFIATCQYAHSKKASFDEIVRYIDASI